MDEDMDYDESYGDMDPYALYDEMYDYMDSDSVQSSALYTIKDLWEDCLIPTCSDGFSAAFKILMCSLLLRFTSSLGFLPTSIIHLTSGIAGLYCLHSFFGSELLYIVIFALIGYLILFVLKAQTTHHGVICAATCFLFLILCELFIVEYAAWHRIRGCQMVLAMKLISLAFDIDNGNHVLPSLVECFGYFFCVGTIIFGPWISYSTYSKILVCRNGSIKWAIKIIQSFLLSFTFLTLSTCWSSWLFQYTTWKWLVAYRDAFSFRSSHYFVSYLSEALALASGISVTTGTWSLPVASPLKIELPRSLVEVVIYWNVPMHFWLKTYVFKTAKPLGNFAAVLLTYIASSLLHGLNFQLAAVLLSLGFYTYIEYVLRKYLANIFNACILARKCKKDCLHKHKSREICIIITNFAFGVLAVFHLAYLGVMFNSSSSIQEEGYSMHHTLEKWSNLEFASHWVALATYAFYTFI